MYGAWGGRMRDIEEENFFLVGQENFSCGPNKHWKATEKL